MIRSIREKGERDHARKLANGTYQAPLTYAKDPEMAFFDLEDMMLRSNELDQTIKNQESQRKEK